MKKLLLGLVIIVLGLTLSSFNEQQAQAKVSSREIHVYFEGERLTFEDTDPVLIDSRTMVPFRKILKH